MNEIAEGKVKKGGQNERPSGPRPKWDGITGIPKIPLEESVDAGLSLLTVIVDVIPEQATGEQLARFWGIIAATHAKRPTS